jgi:hypothetical protein
MSADVIETALVGFEKVGLASSSGEEPKVYKYSPSSDEMNADAEQAFKAYNTQRIQVITIIYSGPMQSFSDAFKIRREEED